MGLIKVDLMALKAANDVVFRYYGKQSTIEAIKRVSDTNPFEQVHIIPCSTRTVIYGYSYNGRHNYDYEIEKAFAMSHCSRNCSVWQTISSLLKANDEVTLFWKAGAGNNGYLKDASLVCDHLEIEVQRSNKTMSFIIESSVSKNNSNRMCQIVSKGASL